MAATTQALLRSVGLALDHLPRHHHPLPDLYWGFHRTLHLKMCRCGAPTCLRRESHLKFTQKTTHSMFLGWLCLAVQQTASFVSRLTMATTHFMVRTTVLSLPSCRSMVRSPGLIDGRVRDKLKSSSRRTRRRRTASPVTLPKLAGCAVHRLAPTQEAPVRAMVRNRRWM